jgi:hypothetical protein
MDGCANPTFTAGGTDLLSSTDPQPPACDEAGPNECVTVTVPGHDTQQETINVNVPIEPGVLTMSVSGEPVLLGTARLSPDSRSFSAGGLLGAITISDGRSDTSPGWSVNGQISDFLGAAGRFSGSYLGWSPVVVTQDAGDDVVAGAAVTAGTTPGLTGASGLASAAAGGGLGTSVLSANLDLEIPSSTLPGAYSATLTITAIEQ